MAYAWLGEQGEDFSYLEYPHQIYYTDRLYQSEHGKELLNQYHHTPDQVKTILWRIDEEDFVPRFKALGGRFVFFHRETEKSEKQRVAESWGFPAWGTHGEQPQDEGLYLKNEDYFESDPRFKEIINFGDIIVFEVL